MIQSVATYDPFVTDPSDVRRAAGVQAYDEARAAGDHEAMASAAIALVRLQAYGTIPGRLPAYLHDAYQLASGAPRAELAIAIARVWVYSGQADRATEFADEALTFAESHGDPTLLAHALDARLLVCWGPDDFDERLRLTAVLDDTVAHVSDTEVRMFAHLWRLTTAMECLDVPAIRRQLRMLESLAAEAGSPRVQFFAASRRAMHAVLVGDLTEAAAAHREAVAAGEIAGEPDAHAIGHALTAAIARQSGDRETMLAEAPVFEDFGSREGVMPVAAEAAQLWLAAGDLEQAGRLLRQLAGDDFSRVPRDGDWLLVVTALTEVAAACGARELADCAIALLTPYAGRAVVNGGAVLFAGVVDHYLSLACAATGRAADAKRWAGQAAVAYERIGAVWWSNRLRDRPVLDASELRLRPIGDSVWEIGRPGALSTLREMKGLRYLRLLLARPGVAVAATDLVAVVAGHPGVTPADEGRVELVDRRALAAYRARLAELDDEIDEAGSWSDGTRRERLDAERSALLAEVRSVTGLGGRARTTADATERARVAVRKAIAAAIARIGAADPSLGRLLSDTVTTGADCCYQPDPDRAVTWLLDGDATRW